ncbi:MAG: hypothetical protein EAZ92_14975 [Candidatus Kapaibacterium sp.]|nr:MAG: hypothetical protein EAZ92_14975 [Candidatus Kapabacteria bacterium]
MPRKLENGRLWTARQAALYLGVGIDAVRKLMAEKFLRTIAPYPNNMRELRTTHEWCDEWIANAIRQPHVQQPAAHTFAPIEKSMPTQQSRQKFSFQGAKI